MGRVLVCTNLVCSEEVYKIIFVGANIIQNNRRLKPSVKFYAFCEGVTKLVILPQRREDAEITALNINSIASLRLCGEKIEFQIHPEYGARGKGKGERG